MKNSVFFRFYNREQKDIDACIKSLKALVKWLPIKTTQEPITLSVNWFLNRETDVEVLFHFKTSTDLNKFKSKDIQIRKIYEKYSAPKNLNPRVVYRNPGDEAFCSR